MYHLSSDNVWMHKTSYIKNNPVNVMTEKELEGIRRDD
jgi:hypothetical protein